MTFWCVVALEAKKLAMVPQTLCYEERERAKRGATKLLQRIMIGMEASSKCDFTLGRRVTLISGLLTAATATSRVILHASPLIVV